eukprot:gene2396-18040_t
MAGKLEGDLELDSESMQGDLGSNEVVRKSIPLKLKKPKLKVKGSKSSKSKKEKKSTSSSEHKEAPEDGKSHKTTKKVKSVSSGDAFPKSDKEELDWSQKILAIGEKVQDPMIHMCESCTLPVLVYGRLSPCKHVFCLTCAEKFKGHCPRCAERVDRIEPAGIGQIFVCSFGGSRHGISGCRRSYLSQRDLLAHIKHRHQKDGIPHSDADTFAKRLDERTQQTARMPFLGVPMMPTTIRPNFGQVNPPQMPIDNRMLQGITQREQVFLEGQRLPMMGQFQQAAPPQQFQPMAQQGFRPDQAMLQRAAVQSQMTGVDPYLVASSGGQYAGAPVSRPGPMTLPPNPMQFPNSTGQYIPPNIQQPAPIQQAAGLQQPAGLPQGRVDPLQQTNLPIGRVDGMQMGRAGVDGTWQGVAQGVAQGLAPQDWTAGQRGAEMQGTFGSADAARFQRSF